jgi:hypothetical protein
MPYLLEELTRVFMEFRMRPPSKFELDRICERIYSIWPESPRPKLRPFDAMYRLRIARYPSDLDLQISSDQLVQRAMMYMRGLDLNVGDLFVKNERYAFVHKGIIAEVAQHLTSWALRQSDTLYRPVTLAVFPSAGPPKRRGQSSHFKRTDWVVLRIGEEVRNEVL